MCVIEFGRTSDKIIIWSCRELKFIEWLEKWSFVVDFWDGGCCWISLVSDGTVLTDVSG